MAVDLSAQAGKFPVAILLQPVDPSVRSHQLGAQLFKLAPSKLLHCGHRQRRGLLQVLSTVMANSLDGATDGAIQDNLWGHTQNSGSRPGFQGAHAAVAWRQRPTRGFTAVLSPYSYSCSHTGHRAQRCWTPAKIRLCAEEMCRTTLPRSATGSIPRWMLALARAPSPSNGAKGMEQSKYN